MTNRVLNWRPALPDHRDFNFKSVFKIGPPLPAAVTLELLCPPIVDQQQEGSCTANAGGSGAFDFLQMLEIREKLLPSEAPQEFVPSQFQPCSRNFIYYCERDANGTTGEDSGASIRDVCKVLTGLGAPPERMCPYGVATMYEQPLHQAYVEAARHRVKRYFALDGLDDLRHCLADGFPFLAGLSIYDSFLGSAVASTGIVPLPGINESLQGGHALCFVGYDDTTRMFRGRNSWGTSWGQAGYFEIPYDYLDNSGLASEFFTLRN